MKAREALVQGLTAEVVEDTIDGVWGLYVVTRDKKILGCVSPGLVYQDPAAANAAIEQIRFHRYNEIRKGRGRRSAPEGASHVNLEENP